MQRRRRGFGDLVALDEILPSVDLVGLERGSATNLTGFDSCWPQGMVFCVSGAPAPLDRPGVGLYSSLPYFLATRQVLSPVDYCRCRGVTNDVDSFVPEAHNGSLYFEVPQNSANLVREKRHLNDTGALRASLAPLTSVCGSSATQASSVSIYCCVGV